MFNRKTDYALNKKDPNAIVYPDGQGGLIRLTKDSFASEEEFARWKEWSDACYHDIEKADHIYSNRAAPMENIPEEAAHSTEELLLDAELEEERELLRRALLAGLDSCLTRVQSRRVRLYYFHGMSEERIAELEGARQQSVSESLESARKKLKKFLEKHPV